MITGNVTGNVPGIVTGLVAETGMKSQNMTGESLRELVEITFGTGNHKD